MSKLAAGDLMSLEQYARERPAFRAQVLRHKTERQLAVGPNATWCFEDRLTVQYQVQEMLRAERIFEPQGIQDELEAYNPLIPDGANWKVTLLIEFAQPVERVRALARLRGIEDRCWVQVAGHERVFAIADEDLPRTGRLDMATLNEMNMLPGRGGPFPGERVIRVVPCRRVYRGIWVR